MSMIETYLLKEPTEGRVCDYSSIVLKHQVRPAIQNKWYGYPWEQERCRAQLGAADPRTIPAHRGACQWRGYNHIQTMRSSGTCDIGRDTAPFVATPRTAYLVTSQLASNSHPVSTLSQACDLPGLLCVRRGLLLVIRRPRKGTSSLPLVHLSYSLTIGQASYFTYPGCWEHGQGYPTQNQAVRTSASDGLDSV